MIDTWYALASLPPAGFMAAAEGHEPLMKCLTMRLLASAMTGAVLHLKLLTGSRRMEHVARCGGRMTRNLLSFHPIDAVGVVESPIGRIQAFLLPIKMLVFSVY